MQTDPQLTAAAAGVFILIMSITWGLVWIGLAIGMGYIAARLNKSVALWVILSLIPIYNLFFYYYVGFYVICHVIGRLEQITARVEGVVPPAPVRA